jgi:LysM repeat protein
VPPKADIELWDSGTAVGARAGDTLQSLALQYHLPRWSLAQANPGPADSPLIPGERITVPRHLAPVAGIAAPMTSAR